MQPEHPPAQAAQAWRAALNPGPSHLAQPLQGLTALSSLTLLDVGSNRIASMEGIEQLTGLADLWLGQNRIAGIECLSRCVSCAYPALLRVEDGLTKASAKLFLHEGPVLQQPSNTS